MISTKYNINESHDHDINISHSMDVLRTMYILQFANDIYEQQVYLYPPLTLKDYTNVIQICPLLHDICVIKNIL